MEDYNCQGELLEKHFLLVMHCLKLEKTIEQLPRSYSNFTQISEKEFVSERIDHIEKSIVLELKCKEEKIKEMESYIKELKSENYLINTENKRLEEKYEKIKCENETHHLRREQYYSGFQVGFEAIKNEVETLRKDKKELMEQIEKLRKSQREEVSELERDINILRRENQNYMSLLSSYKTEQESYQSELKTLGQRFENCQYKIKKYEERFENQENQNKNVAKERESLIKEKETLLKEKEKIIKNLESENNSLKNQFSVLQNEFSERNVFAEKLQKNIKENENAIKILEEKNEELSQNLSKKEQFLKRNEEKLKDYENQYSYYVNKMNEMTSVLHEKSTELQSIEKTHKNLLKAFKDEKLKFEQEKRNLEEQKNEEMKKEKLSFDERIEEILREKESFEKKSLKEKERLGNEIKKLAEEISVKEKEFETKYKEIEEEKKKAVQQWEDLFVEMKKQKEIISQLEKTLESSLKSSSLRQSIINENFTSAPLSTLTRSPSFCPESQTNFETKTNISSNLEFSAVTPEARILQKSMLCCEECECIKNKEKEQSLITSENFSNICAQNKTIATPNSIREQRSHSMGGSRVFTRTPPQNIQTSSRVSDTCSRVCDSYMDPMTTSRVSRTKSYSSQKHSTHNYLVSSLFPSSKNTLDNFLKKEEKTFTNCLERSSLNCSENNFEKCKQRPNENILERTKENILEKTKENILEKPMENILESPMVPRLENSLGKTSSMNSLKPFQQYLSFQLPSSQGNREIKETKEIRESKEMRGAFEKVNKWDYMGSKVLQQKINKMNELCEKDVFADKNIRSFGCNKKNHQISATFASANRVFLNERIEKENINEIIMKKCMYDERR